MLTAIHLEQFMAHEATSIELAPGVTVITGPNNIGKSAVVEALRYLLYNPAPKHVIRHGAHEAVVRLVLDSGEVVTWRRQDRHASYLLEAPGQPPQEYHKFGREVPEEIRSLLRLEQVVTDSGDRIDIHLGNQREPIFLLDRPGSQAAGFFAASTEADYLLKMQQALKRRREEARREQTRLAAELEALEAELAQLEPLAALDAALREAEAVYELIAATQRQLPGWQALLDNLAETSGRLQLARSMAGLLESLRTPPALADTVRLAQTVANLQAATRQQAQEQALAAVLTSLQPPPALHPLAPLEELTQAISRTQTELALADAREQALAALTLPPEVLPTRELDHHLLTLAETTGQWQEESRRLAALEALQPPPLLADTALLLQLVEELTATARAQTRRREEQAVLAGMAPPPELSDLRPLNVLIQDLSGLEQRQRHHRQGLAVLAQLTDPPELVDITRVEETMGLLSRALADLEAQRQQQVRLDQELARMRTQIQTYLQEVGVCPLCGSPLDLGHFLEERHV